MSKVKADLKLYNYNIEGIYTHESLAKKDPIEGKFLIPKKATTLQPTIPDGQIAFFNGTEWEYKTDTRGTYYDKTSKEKVEIKVFDADISNLTLVPPPSRHHYWNSDESLWIEDEQERTKDDARSKLGELNNKLDDATDELIDLLISKGTLTANELPQTIKDIRADKATYKAIRDS